MSFESFVATVKETIKDYLPEDYADAQVLTEEVHKLNKSYLALIVQKPGQRIAASINLEELYRWSEEGTKIEALMKDIADTVRSQPPLTAREELPEYDDVKEYLIIRVSGYDKNKAYLEDIPHRKIADLAVTCHLMIKGKEDGMFTTVVTRKMLEEFGITEETLFHDAAERSPVNLPPRIEPMTHAIDRIFFGGVASDQPRSFDEQLAEIRTSEDKMAVITNAESMDGAAVIFYPEILDRIGLQMGKDFFILPSSVNECILLPDDGSMRVSDLESMVKEINRTEVRPEDRLSDTVYRYDRKERIFEKARDYMERKEEREAKQKTEKAFER